MKIYTDGAYRAKINPDIAAWGFIAVDDDGQILHEDAGIVQHPLSRQIDGECEAVIRALEFAYENDIQEVDIYHDLEGLKHWADGSWKRNTPVTQSYYERFNLLQAKLLSLPREVPRFVAFHWVRGHNGNEFNELVDELAVGMLETYTFLERGE